MPEVPSDHSLESVSGACRVSCDHRVGGHDALHRGVSRVQTISHDSKSEIFGCKDTTEVFLLVDDEYTVCALCRTQLRSIGYADMLRYSESGGRA